MAARLRAQTHANIDRLNVIEALYSTSHELTAAGNLQDVARIASRQAARLLGASVVVLIPEDGALCIRGSHPPGTTLGEDEVSKASAVWRGHVGSELRSGKLSQRQWSFLPASSGGSTLGVLAVRSEGGVHSLAGQHRLLESLAHQTALSIERARFVAEIDRSARAEEIARLRSALLNSVSHDLGTPLAVIRASAEVLRDRGMADLGDRGSQIIADIIEECDTLNRFIGNLLNMTRLASGAITPIFDTHDLRDIVAIAIKLARSVLAHHRVELRLDPQVPPVRVDAVLLEQPVFNLLDNAAKYSPPATTILIESFAEAGSACLRITDQGRGIRPEDIEHIFEMFYRSDNGPEAPKGTGLGLAIARGFVQALNGRLTASNRTDGPGAMMMISLPLQGSLTRKEQQTIG